MKKCIQSDRGRGILLALAILFLFTVIPSVYSQNIINLNCEEKNFKIADSGYNLPVTCTWDYPTQFGIDTDGDGNEVVVELDCEYGNREISVTYQDGCFSGSAFAFSTTQKATDFFLTPDTISSPSAACSYTVLVTADNPGDSRCEEELVSQQTVTGTIFNSVIGVDVGAEAERADDPFDPQIKSIDSRLIRVFARAPQAGFCRYLLTKWPPNNFFSYLNYVFTGIPTTTLSGCVNNAYGLQCRGDMEFNPSKNEFEVIVDFRDRGIYQDNIWERDMNNEVYLTYGVYCTATDGYPPGVFGRGSVSFYIDTLPPNVTSTSGSSTGTPNIIFADQNSINTRNTAGTMTINSRNISMSFETNELAMCKFQETSNWEGVTGYDGMTRDVSTDFAETHQVYFNPLIGIRRTFHIACMDVLGNRDGDQRVGGLVQTQTAFTQSRTGTFSNATHTILFLLEDPDPVTNITVNDTPNDHGHSITVSWKRSPQDGLGEDYVTRYEIYRVRSNFTDANSLNKVQLVEAADDPDNKSVVRLNEIVPARRDPNDDGIYTIIDSSMDIVNEEDYYYYIMARYYNDTFPQIMQNVMYNSSSIAVSEAVQAIDNNAPPPPTNLRFDFAMGDIEGTKLKLLWDLSTDDGNNSNDVTHYTVWRARQGSQEYIQEIFTPIANLTNGTSFYLDINGTLTNFSTIDDDVEDHIVYRNETYCYFVQVTDNDGLTSNSTEICGSPNARPFFHNMSLTPEDPNKLTPSLLCEVFISDHDGSPDLLNNVNITWEILHIATFERTVINVTPTCSPFFKGDFQNRDYENLTTECIAGLTNESYNKGDKVWCRVTAFDGYEFAINLSDNSSFSERIVYINNSPPIARNVRIFPNDADLPLGSSNLLCEYDYYDIDGDPEDTTQVSFKWYINNDGMNQFLEVLGQVGQILPHQFIDQNDEVICAVQPRDIDNSWLQNPLTSPVFFNSSAVRVKDNSIPQIINYFVTYPSGLAAIPGEEITFHVQWRDIDPDDTVKTYICDGFTSKEFQFSNGDDHISFGDNGSQSINSTFYTNKTGKYVSTISIKPYKFQRSGNWVYAARTEVELGDADYGQAIESPPDSFYFFDTDFSGIYTPGEPIVNLTNTSIPSPQVFHPKTHDVLRGPPPPFLATLTPLNTSNQKVNGTPTDYDPRNSSFRLYRSTGTNTNFAGTTRLEVVAEDGMHHIDFTMPIYDMYVYEVATPGAQITKDSILIARDLNNIFQLGRYNHFSPEYNAQPLPNMHLAFVLCIDSDDNGKCDVHPSNGADRVYVRAETDPGDYRVEYYNPDNETLYNPDIIINYDFGLEGGCFGKLYCETSGFSPNTIQTCTYTVQESDLANTIYYVRVCDNRGACSLARQGDFNVSARPYFIASETPIILPEDKTDRSFPFNYSTTLNLTCNASYFAPDTKIKYELQSDGTWGNGTFGGNNNTAPTNLTYTWYNNRTGTIQKTNFTSSTIPYYETSLGELWVCEAEGFNHYNISTGKVNSSAVIIGSIVDPQTAPVITLVTTNSNISHPVNEGEEFTWTVHWNNMGSDLGFVYVCNSSNATFYGCNGVELTRAEFVSSPTTLSWIVDPSLLGNFTTVGDYNLNYTIVVTDTFGKFVTYSNNITPDRKDNNFSINHLPVTSIPIIDKNSGYFNCTYDIWDSDNSTTNYSVYNTSNASFFTDSAPKPIIKWYHLQNNTWVKHNFSFNDNIIPEGLIKSGDTWRCEVTPFDGYAYGIPRNSSIEVFEFTGPRILDWTVGYMNSPLVAITPSSPVTLGEKIYVSVDWLDANDDTVTLYVTSSEDFNIAHFYAVNTSSISPIIASFNSSDLLNLGNSYNFSDLTFFLSNSENVTQLNNSNFRNFSVYVNRRPTITASNINLHVNTSFNAFFCDVTILLDDYFEDYQYKNESTKYLWYVDSGNGYVAMPQYNVSLIPFAIAKPNERWLCQVTPCDNYVCGNPVNASKHVTIDPIHFDKMNATIFRNLQDSPIIVSASSPATLGELIQFSVTTTDPIFASSSASFTMYVCETNASNLLGCLNQTEYCRASTTTNTASCTFNTSNINLSKYDLQNQYPRLNEINYTIILYNQDGVSSNYFNSEKLGIGTFNINHVPKIDSINVDINTTEGSFYCNVAISDKDGNTVGSNNPYGANELLTKYSWLVDSGDGNGFVLRPIHDGLDRISFASTAPGEKWKCQATPCDNFVCGVSNISENHQSSINQTPGIVNIRLFSVVDGIATILNESNPAIYGENVRIEVDWVDSDLYTDSETIRMYVCEMNNSNPSGCFNTTTYCSVTSSSTSGSCTFNTSIINLSKYTNQNRINYSIVLYDSENKKSGHYYLNDSDEIESGLGNFYLNRRPVVNWTNITPTYPTNDQQLICNYDIYDPDQENSNNTYNSSANNTVSIRWYLDRNNSGFQPTLYTTATITPDVTQKLDRWMCEVTAFDGFAYSFPKMSSNWVTVGNLYNYTEYPNITKILVSANSSNRATVGDKVFFSIEYTHENLPNQFARAFICNSTEFINNTGCVNQSFVNFMNFTKSNPILAEYTVKPSDIATYASSGVVNFYVMVCDDFGRCSNISNKTGPSYTFYINDKPTFYESPNINKDENSDNLICEFLVNPGDIGSEQNYSISWYKRNASVSFCGDGVIDYHLGEECDVGAMDFTTCSGYNAAFRPGEGTLLCDYNTCQYDTRYCIPINPEGNYCGDGIRADWEQCDGNDPGEWLYQSCSEIGSFTGGSLSCNEDCTLDISQCTGGAVSFCGNGIVEEFGGEECDVIDGQIVGKYTSCSDFPNFLGGNLRCDPYTCKYDVSECITSANLYVDLQVYDVATLPALAYSPGDVVVCKVTPYDGYNYGLPVFSPEYNSGISSTPMITNITAFFRDSNNTVVINTPSSPVEYGKMINISITWQDFEQFTPAGETAKFFICDSSISTFQGCLGETYCSTTLSPSNPAICQFNTSLLNTNLTNFTYHVHVYDSTLNHSNQSAQLYLNRLPVLLEYNITPSVPYTTDNLICAIETDSYDDISSPNQTTLSNYNDTYDHFRWFYRRSGVWNEFNSGGNPNITNYFTQPGDEWICQITLSDPYGSTSPVNTTSVFIVESTNISQPKITELYLISDNPHLGDIDITSSGTVTIYKHDNTTNVGKNVNFIINWVDADQYTPGSESVRLWICDNNNFIPNSGCVNRTLYYQDYTSNKSLQIQYTAQEIDNSIQNFSIFICDSTLNCSTAISNNFTVNHPFDKSVKPNLIVSTNIRGQDYLICDYDTPYTYSGGNGEDEGVDIGDYLHSITYNWYLDTGSGYQSLNLNSPFYDDELNSTDKIKCQIFATDVFGFNSGFINSTVLDMQSVPILWHPVSNITSNGYYIMYDDGPHVPSPNNITLIGYVPSNIRPDEIVSKTYHGFNVPYDSSTNTLEPLSTKLGTAEIVVSTPANANFILVNDYTGIKNHFNSSTFLELENNDRDYFERFEITGAYSTLPGVYRIDISPNITNATIVGNVVTAYNSSKPSSWFNLTVDVSDGINYVFVRSNTSNAPLSQARRVNIGYDVTSPTINIEKIQIPTTNTTPILRFNLTDDTAINLSSLMVNVSNGTHYRYHFKSNTQLPVTQLTLPSNIKEGQKITCNEINQTDHECFVTLNVTEIINQSDYYYVNITVSDLIPRTTSNNTTFRVNSGDLPKPVSFARPVQNTQSLTFGLFFDYINATEIQYAVGTAPYPDSRWNITRSATNYSGKDGGFTISDFTSLSKFVDYNYNIYYDNTEPIINSTNLYLENISTTTVLNNGTGLKAFTANEKTNCTPPSFDHTCAIIRTNLNGTVEVLYNNSPINTPLTLYDIDLTIKYFDANNNSRYDPGEPVFRTDSANNFSITNITEQLIINSKRAVLTLNLQTDPLPLLENVPYRVAVRYYVASEDLWSDWTFTNPIIYSPNFTAPDFFKPSAPKVYDRNMTHSEPNDQVDLAIDNKLRWYWTESIAQNTQHGEEILYYEYAIGYQPYPFDGWNSVLDWTNAEKTRDISAANPLNAPYNILPLIVNQQTYYLSVRARSSFGIYSEISSSDGIVYYDLTPPEIKITQVANITSPSNYFTIREETASFIAEIYSPNENISQCGFSTFRVPFDSNYKIMNQCNNSNDREDRTIIECNLTNMDGTPLQEGIHYFYIACLDENGNANTLSSSLPDSQKTQMITIDYSFPKFPEVINASVFISSDRVLPSPRNYSFSNEIVYCNYTAIDYNGGGIVDATFRWYINGTELPVYENTPYLNLSKYSVKPNYNISCEARVQDATGRWSQYTQSNNLPVNYSRPFQFSLVSPNNLYSKATATLRWNYSGTINNDELSYYLIIYNKTSYGSVETLNNTFVANISGINNNYTLPLDTTHNISIDGEYIWTIKACIDIDNKYNCTYANNNMSFVKDTTGPLAQILVPDNQSTVGSNFNIIAKVNDSNQPNVNVSEVIAMFFNTTTNDNILNVTMNLGNDGFYHATIDETNNENITNGTYELFIYSKDTLGNDNNTGNVNFTININTFFPILQIDYPPWVFREQFLNHDFELNLSAYNATWVSYTIMNNKTETIVMSDYKQFVSERNYSFKDLFNISGLADGFYIINLSGGDKLENTKSKYSWFVIDTTPPKVYSLKQNSSVAIAASETIWIHWDNNLFNESDNRFGIKNVSFYYNVSDRWDKNITQDNYLTTHNQFFEIASDTVDITINNSNYSFVLPANLNEKYKIIYWFGCAQDYAGNANCSSLQNVTVISESPIINQSIQDIIMQVQYGNNTIQSDNYIMNPNNTSLNHYYAITLPNGTLLYDPLNNESYTRALHAKFDGLLFYDGMDNNSVLIERAHQNLLINPSLHHNETFNDSNGTYITIKPIGWKLVNNANWTKSDSYELHGEPNASVNVSAKGYFYQDVNVSNSTVYSLSMYMKSAHNDSTQVTGRLHINWYNAQGQYLESTLNLTSNLSRPILTNEWKRYNLTTTSPPNARTARIYLDTDSNETWALIDNVVFEKTDYPTYYNKENHDDGYLSYPIFPFADFPGSRPYLNATQGTLHIRVNATWNNSDFRTRYLFDVNNSLGNFAATIARNYNTSSETANLIFSYGNASVSTDINWSKDKFVNLSFTWNATNISIFENGNLSNFTNGTFSIPNFVNSNYLFIGSDKSKQRQIDALLDELVIFDYAKPSYEIASDVLTVPINLERENEFKLITYINSTVNDSTSIVTIQVNSTKVPKLTLPDLSYDQRLQLFGSDGVEHIAANVINVKILTNYSYFTPQSNVSYFNYTTNYPIYTELKLNSSRDYSPFNITFITNMSNTHMYNSASPVVYNFASDLATFGFKNVSSNYLVATDSIVMDSKLVRAEVASSTIKNTDIIDAKVASSTIKNTNIYGISSEPAIINNSILINSSVNISNVNNSELINSIVSLNSSVNGSFLIDSIVSDYSKLLDNVNLTNSIITNNTILKNVNITDAFVDPSYIENSTISEDSTIFDSYIKDSIIINSTIKYAASPVSDIEFSAFGIFNSTVKECVIGTYTHNGNKTNISLHNANVSSLDNDPNDCRLISGIAKVNQSGTNFTYEVSSGTAQPLLRDIWNYTPEITPRKPNNAELKDNDYIVGPFIKLSALIVDPSIASSMEKVVTVTWNYTYFHAQIPTPPDSIVRSNITNGTSPGVVSYETEHSTSFNNSILNITYTATDKFGNNETKTIYNVTYIYSETYGEHQFNNCPVGGVTVLHGDSRTFFSTSSSANCNQFSQSRTCNDGVLSGDSQYQFATCSAPGSGGSGGSNIQGNVIVDNNRSISGRGNYTPQPQPPQPQPPQPQPPQPQPPEPQPPQPPQEPAQLEPQPIGFIWWLIIFILIALLVFMGFLVAKERKKEQELERQLQSNATSQVSSGHSIAEAATAGLYAKQPVRSNGPVSDSIINLEKYIIASLDSGVKPTRIKENLASSGWESSVVEVVLHKIMLSGDKLEEVEKYIKNQIKKGLSDDEIKTKLVNSHWNSEIADLIIADVHKISKNNQRLTQYISAKLNQGKSIDEILQILVSIGWNEYYISKILEKYQK
ncbi:MAG: LamG-like jellyroll fold domain-containing protein [Candidatus Woesearchaeota archaeon]